MRPDFSLAENEDNRLRHIRLHEQVNELPDANYATLRHLLGHLHKSAPRPLLLQVADLA
jgi:hypothetical protein